MNKLLKIAIVVLISVLGYLISFITVEGPYIFLIGYLTGIEVILVRDKITKIFDKIDKEKRG